MATLEDGFNRVLADFKRRLSPEEEKKFKFVSLNDLNVAIIKLQDNQKKTKTARNLARIQPFLQAMSQYQQIIEVFLNTSKILCFVWGPLKFILMTANNLNKAFDVILDTYTEISENFPLLLKYRQNFDDNDHLKQILLWIYEDMLKFHLQALRIFSRPIWEKLFNAAWHDFQASTKPILSNLARHRELLDKVANMQNIEDTRNATLQFIQESRDARSQTQLKLDELHRQNAAERKRTVISWLAAVDSREDQRYYAGKRKISTSGRWILDISKIEQFLDRTQTDEIPALWLTGIPGAGKTILGSVLIEEALVKAQTLPCSVIYFYCRDQDNTRNTFLSVAKAFIQQLLTQNEHILPYLYEECRKSGQINLASSHDCASILSTMMKDVGPISFFIDGIDECDKKERKAMLKFFIDEINRSEEDCPGRLRGLFIGQELSDIKGALHQSEILRLTQAHNEVDIREYSVRKAEKIQQIFNMPDGQKKAVVQLVCDRSEGMFLFAKLVLKNLIKQSNLQDVYKELNDEIFPRGFDQAYARITKRIFENQIPENQRTARQVLGWVTCAKRPLLWREIQAASSIDVNQGNVNFERRQLAKTIRQICGSLVDILPGDRIQLVHSTAKLYLFKNRHIMEQREERALALLSMQYLSFECFESSKSDEQLKEFLLNGTYAFFDYSCLHWSDHLYSATQSLSVIELSNTSQHGMAINEFLELHQPGPVVENEVYVELRKGCERIQSSDCYDTLVWLLSDSKTNRLASNQLEALGSLGSFMSRVRTMLKTTTLSIDLDPTLSDKLRQYYGENIHKCPWHACYYFHEGFSDASLLARHISRHEKPFCCTELGCTRELIGWATEKELKKHMSQVHPDPETLSFKFPYVKKLPPSAFQCDLCPKQYTRASSLNTHKLRQHLKERNFECGTCKKKFVRKYECDRHEKAHTTDSPSSSQPGVDTL